MLAEISDSRVVRDSRRRLVLRGVRFGVRKFGVNPGQGTFLHPLDRELCPRGAHLKNPLNPNVRYMNFYITLVT